MKKLKLFLIACLSGVLLSLAWPTAGFAPLLLIALVPLLWVEDYISKDKTGRFGPFAGLFYSYIPFLIWNVLTTYWVINATAFALVAFTFNALFMAVIFQIYHFSKKMLFTKQGKNQNSFLAFLLLPIFYIAFEYLHSQWELSWPWLILGNGFSTMPILIQWYEYTGVFGGTLWIFISNFAALKLLQSILNKEKKKIITDSVIFDAIIILPIVISLILWYSYKDESNKPLDVVVVQPNLEPYDESKQLYSYEIVDLITHLARKETDNNTHFILTPEGCLEERLVEDRIQDNNGLQRLSEFLGNYDKAQWITGSFSRKLESERKETSKEARGEAMPFYSTYNSAIHVKKGNRFEVYHKTKLVPGVERMPYKKITDKVLSLAIPLGNLPIGTLAVDTLQPLFKSEATGVNTTVPICYESVYGEFVIEQVRKGAELLFIITNDSWWGDTPGYRQHCAYASLRAIETRRYIARSANTGTSCFINPKGEISQKTKFWTQDVIKASLVPQKHLTFYVKYGDYLAKIAVFSAVLLLITSYVLKIRNRFNKIKNK